MELQADICLHLYRRFLTLPCFSHASRGCLRSISRKVKKANFSPGELIIKEKDVINTLFFVQRGTVEIVQRDFIVAILGKKRIMMITSYIWAVSRLFQGGPQSDIQSLGNRVR